MIIVGQRLARTRIAGAPHPRRSDRRGLHGSGAYQPDRELFAGGKTAGGNPQDRPGDHISAGVVITAYGAETATHNQFGDRKYRVPHDAPAATWV
jgi:hypothetical protein